MISDLLKWLNGKLERRGDMPQPGWEMDWLYFGGGAPHGRWKWGNPRRLWGVKTRQEIRAEEAEKCSHQD